MRVKGADGIDVEHPWDPKLWYLIGDDYPYVDVLIKGIPIEARDATRLAPRDDPAPEGRKWQRWDLRAELARQRRLGEVSLELKIPKNHALRCYVIPTQILKYPDVIAIVEDIEAELGVPAAWDVITERPDRSWSRRNEAGQTIAPSELVELVEEELRAAHSIRRDPFTELGPRSRRDIPLGENAIVSHWAMRRQNQLRKAAELVATMLDALRSKRARSNPEGRERGFVEETERLFAVERRLSELIGSLSTLSNGVELATMFYPTPLFQRDHRLRRLLRAFAPRVSEALSSVASSRSHYPPMFLNRLWELWGAVWLAKQLRGLGFAGNCTTEPTNAFNACSWRLERQGITIELDYEPDPVVVDYAHLPPAHDRVLPTLEWAARHQDLDPDRPFLGTEARCAPDYILRITTPQARALIVGDACLASPQHHGKGTDKSGSKPYSVERYRRTLGWAVDNQIIRCHPMSGFVLFPPPATAWTDYEKIPGAGDCTLLCPSPHGDPEASRRLERLLATVTPEVMAPQQREAQAVN
ncbi:hypothetical protein AOQ73_26790 [Bradyrhizobium pachyrhizi]|uniref:hypothetical protein n=1 Tax=Bradyrhizobium pachyrhizi TaxID=280333 RepID=UPI000704D784|nr:hypothetical protein [Bradyrhizobium pachyrhizi]KRP89230.1 hypothetical protein AOQ73_26790 [Bradyrhizobium pachyrhizi]